MALETILGEVSTRRNYFRNLGAEVIKKDGFQITSLSRFAQAAALGGFRPFPKTPLVRGLVVVYGACGLARASLAANKLRVES